MNNLGNFKKSAEARRYYFCLRLAALVLALLCLFCAPLSAYAAELNPEDFSVTGCAVLDGETGALLFSKNYTDKIYPASTTKILTALIVLEKCNLDEVITVGAEAAYTKNESNMGLKEGEQLSVRNLLYGLMLKSANEAARALAVHISGSVAAFAELMNQYAANYGMTASKFVTPHGVQSEEHYTTVQDMAKLTLIALNNPALMEICGTKAYSIPATNKCGKRDLVNSNRLLCTNLDPENETGYLYEYATGLKTGSTSAAGGCLIATANRDGRRMIALVFGDMTKNGAKRWGYAKKLFNYAYENTVNTDLATLLKDYTVEQKVYNTQQDDSGLLVCTPSIPEGAKATLKIDADVSALDITVTPTFESTLVAPIHEGDVVGKVTYTLGTDVLFSGDLVASRDVLEFGAVSSDPVSSLDPVQVSPGPNGTTDKQKQIASLMWWWLLVPGILIVFLIIRSVMVNTRRFKFRKRTGRHKKSVSRRDRLR